MDGPQFDAIAKRLARAATRRHALAMTGAFALSEAASVAAKRKKRKKKKKNPGCLTVGGRIVCPQGAVCCDPSRSTVGGCAEFGYPVCCASTPGYSFWAGTTCCNSPFAGDDGVCEDPEYPHCCGSVTDGGCCVSGYPTCCYDPVFDEGYCCAANETCCPETESGCCGSSGVATQSVGAESSRRRVQRGRASGNRQRLDGE